MERSKENVGFMKTVKEIIKENEELNKKVISLGNVIIPKLEEVKKMVEELRRRLVIK